MELDMGWCFCGKKTLNGRGYCSPACEQKDASPSKPSGSKSPITSPLPPALLVSSPIQRRTSNPTPRANNTPSDSFLHRPPLGALRIPPASEISPTFEPSPTFRSRRAYSEAVVPTGPSRLQTLPTFARKPHAIAVAATTSPSLLGRPRPGFARLAMTTGANTPVVPEDAICSTSESEADGGAPLASLPIPSFARPTHRTSLSADLALGLASQATSLGSGMPPVKRHQSQSPVAALIASAASSRSREDIMSWAAAVRERPPGDDSELEEERRPRRTECPPLPSPGDEECVHGTTPKGRTLGSALNFSNVVKAIKGVTSYNNPARTISNSVLGLQSVPSRAEVSRIEVVVGPAQSTDDHYNAGATPTLSTVSLSEVIEPSIMTDNAEQMDMVDDQSSHRHSSTSGRYKAPTQKSSGPIGTTLWNSIAYLRSFAPFSLPGSVAQPTISREPIIMPFKSPTPPRANPLPAAAKVELTQTLRDTLDQDSSDEEVVAPMEMVRSLPMDIITFGSAAVHHEESEPDRERQRQRIAVSRSPSPFTLDREAGESGISRVRGYEASDEDEDTSESKPRGRGRSRRGKKLSPLPRSDRNLVDDEKTTAEEAGERGRRMDRMNESRERDFSVVRGRSRSGTRQIRDRAIRA